MKIIILENLRDKFGVFTLKIEVWHGQKCYPYRVQLNSSLANEKFKELVRQKNYKNAMKYLNDQKAKHEQY